MAEGALEAGTGWAALAEAGPAAQAAFAVIVLTCALIALRGAPPLSALAALLRGRADPGS